MDVAAASVLLNWTCPGMVLGREASWHGLTYLLLVNLSASQTCLCTWILACQASTGNGRDLLVSLKDSDPIPLLEINMSQISLTIYPYIWLPTRAWKCSWVDSTSHLYDLQALSLNPAWYSWTGRVLLQRCEQNAAVWLQMKKKNPHTLIQEIKFTWLCFHFTTAYDHKSVHWYNVSQDFLVMHMNKWHGKINGAMEAEFRYRLEQDGTIVWD